MDPKEKESFEVSQPRDTGVVRQAAISMAEAIGFEEVEREEIGLAASELATNLIRHAKRGAVSITQITEGGRDAIQIETVDSGPGIVDVEEAITDKFSTAGSLGYGLGTVNRMMHEFNIRSKIGVGSGTQVVCRRWVRKDSIDVRPCPLEFGASTRPHLRMAENGDAFVIKKWGESALVAVIDGLGHGKFAHRAAQAARQYVETHFDQPLEGIFRGTSRACRATRGVVMALVRFDWTHSKLTFASVGNIEVRMFGGSEPVNFIVPRGIVGANTRNPVVREHKWERDCVMVFHSDGVSSRWKWEDFSPGTGKTATEMAHRLLRSLAKDEDDATVVVVRNIVQ